MKFQLFPLAATLLSAVVMTSAYATSESAYAQSDTLRHHKASPNTPLYVNWGYDGGHPTPTDCASSTNTDCTLRDAMALAAPGTTIYVAGVTIPLDPGAGYQQLDAYDDITIIGVPGKTTITRTAGCTGTDYRLLEVHDASHVVIKGVTFSCGSSPFVGGVGTDGAGILVDGVNHDGTVLELNNCVVTTNWSSANGGGIANDGTGVLRLIGSRLSGNSAIYHGTNYGHGGAIYNGPDATLIARNSTITGRGDGSDSAVYGGGLYNEGHATLINTSVTGHLVEQAGAGIFNAGAGATLQITGGKSSISSNTARIHNGGGIYNSLGYVSIADEATVASNRARAEEDGSLGQGGGIYTSGGTVVVSSGASVSKNYSASQQRGGGIATYNSTVTLSDAILSGNHGGPGGGIFQVGGVVNIIDSSVFSNSAVTDGLRSGGALFAYSGTATVDHSVMYNNTAGQRKHLAAGYGGAIYNFGATVTVTDSTIANNIAWYKGTNAGVGGGIFHDGGTTTIASSTIAGNNAMGSGAVAGNIYARPGTHVTLSNSIVANGAADSSPMNCQGSVTYLGTNDVYELTGVTDTCGASTAGGQVLGNPWLDVLTDNGGTTYTMALLSGSAAIGTEPSGCALDDQRYEARPANGCDIGAFQTQ